MCQLRWFFAVTLLLWPRGAFCADESEKKNDEASVPHGAVRDGGELQLPRARRTRVTIEKLASEEAAPSESGAKPADDSPKDPDEAVRREDPKTIHEIPEDLGDALSLALIRNPQLLVAEAKVREAQAEYDQVSLSVVHDVTVAFRQYAQDKATLQRSEGAKGMLRMEPQIREHRENLERAKAKLVYILGIDTRREARERPWEFRLQLHPNPVTIYEKVHKPATLPSDAGKPEISPESAISAELREALQTPIDADFEDTPLNDVLDYIAASVGQKSGGIQFVKKENSLDAPVTLTLRQVTVQAELQAIADLTETTFVFRDYGILVIRDGGEATKYRLIHAPMIAPAPDPALQTFPLPPAE